jgi:hypothetical protein
LLVAHIDLMRSRAHAKHRRAKPHNQRDRRPCAALRQCGPAGSEPAHRSIQSSLSARPPARPPARPSTRARVHHRSIDRADSVRRNPNGRHRGRHTLVQTIVNCGRSRAVVLWKTTYHIQACWRDGPPRRLRSFPSHFAARRVCQASPATYDVL